MLTFRSHSGAITSFLCFLLLAAPVGAQERADVFVLSIGIDRYQFPTPSLKGCVNDAVGMARVFANQEGKQFAKAETIVLSDDKAGHMAIGKALKALESKGKSGDWYVIVMSGHGGINQHEWGFVAHDGKNITDTSLLALADRLAGEGKKVVIIIDACHAGQLRFTASALLNRYKEGDPGGILLMVSSMPDQLSTALGDYSAFARAAEEGLMGIGDFDGDEKVTLKELRRFTYNRVVELCLSRRPFPGTTVGYQDSAIDASLSFSESTPLVQAKRPDTPPVADDGPDVSSPHLPERIWKVSMPSKGMLPPLHYELKLDPFGRYRAIVREGVRPTKIANGAYHIKEHALLLRHHQGVDRLELVKVAPTEFEFRFQGKIFKAKTEMPAPGVLLVDATGRLQPDDPPDRLRKDSPHKVHRVKLEQDQSYIIDLQSPDFDTFVRIEDEFGTHLAENDDGGEGRNSRMLFSPPKTGEYHVIVTTFRSGSGVYHLHVERSMTRPPDHPPLGAMVFNVAEALTEKDARDTIRKESFCRIYKVELKAGNSYTIDMVSNEFDTYLRLEDETGRQIAFDDDGGGDLNARLSFTPSRTATYRIVATSFRTAMGRFTLTVRAAEPGLIRPGKGP